MSTPKTPPVCEAPRSVRVKSLRQRTVTVVGVFLVAASFGIAVAPAATAEPVSMNQIVPADPDRPAQKCNGNYPGFCVP